MLKNELIKRIPLLILACVMLLFFCGCDGLSESLEEVIEKTPVTEVELPLNDGDNILDEYFDKVFGSGETSTDSPGTYTDSFSDVFGDSNTNAPTEAPSGSAPVVIPDNSYLRVDYVDVGQADFIVVECDNEYMTIDAGNRADGQFIYSYLDKRGIDHIEYMVVTHGHEDHCGSAATILEHSTVGTVFCSVTEYDTVTFRKFVEKVSEKGLEITVPQAGDTFSLGSAEIQILGPVKEYEEPNDTSIVLKLTYGDTSFLFTGDAEETSEKDIIAAGYDLSADVLKAPHHGSYTSSSYVFLREVMPEYIVIQSSRTDAPDYDHPHDVVLSRYRDLGATVYRNDLQGTVTCYSDGINITFEVERNPDADTLYELNQ